MNQSLWIAKTGLDAQQTKMSTIANNLANAGTTGYKRSRAGGPAKAVANIKCRCAKAA